MIPQACTPVCLTEPSRVCAKTSVFLISSFSESWAFFKSLTSLKACAKVTPGLSGTNFANLSASFNGSRRTLATSLIADFAAIEPNVIILATRFSPYLSITHFKTFSLPSSSKSISISGMETRSGLRNRSKSKLYFSGSISVIFKQKATAEPAAEPLPGPTETPISRAAFRKSQTIKK